MTKHVCSTCKYWGEADTFRYSPEDGRYGAELRVCSCPKFIYYEVEENPKIERDSLRYWDYDGYEAHFEVGPDFGCVRWEQKKFACYESD
jgi:hypothetical protein